MAKFYSNLKTSDKITFLFTVFNFISLIVLLIGINVIYFFSWYSDQKSESMYDMNMNYNIYSSWNNLSNLEAFKEYILQKDTLIIPNDWWDLICSRWVETKIHNNIDEIKDDLFYSNWEKVFFIFTRYYEDIWEVKVFLDTTPYVKSQILIIKISLIIILVSLFLYFIIWKKISKYSLKNLNNISNQFKDIDIEKDFEKVQIVWNKDDEINILANTLNKSFTHIKDQTQTLKQFITDVSHEFKTPLMVIDSHIDLYEKKKEKELISEEDTQVLLKKVKGKTADLNSILETFLLLSRVENNIEKLDFVEVYLDKYMKKITDEFIENHPWNINIQYKCLENTKVKIEKNTFDILFKNLLSNAIKFSKEAKKIEIWCNNDIFWIKDNWIWIKKEKINKIWDKFFRQDKNKEWFWVWLFIVKRLVQLYNWEIQVESEESKGTKFIINF